MVQVTAYGLREDAAEITSIPDVRWAVAVGANTIVATYDEPVTGLVDGLIVGFRAAGANTVATPTFAPDGLTPHTIVKRGGQALAAGDIPAANAECLVRYNSSGTRWELLNPATTPQSSVVPWAVATGTDAIAVSYTPAVLSLTDGLIVGFRASGANTVTAPTFAPNGLTAKDVVKQGGATLVANDILTGMEVFVRYNASNDQWELLNPKYDLTAAQTADLAFSGNGELFKVLVSDDTGGTNVNTAQPWFPTAGAVTVEADKTYLFEGFLHTTRAAGTTSHTTGISFGGSATLTDIRYLAQCKEGDANDLQDMSGFVGAAATTLVVKAASTSGTENVIIRVQGIVRINAAGTFIPQFIYSAAPGNTPTIKANSYFRMVRLGAGTVESKGTWA